MRPARTLLYHHKHELSFAISDKNTKFVPRLCHQDPGHPHAPINSPTSSPPSFGGMPIYIILLREVGDLSNSLSYSAARRRCSNLSSDSTHPEISIRYSFVNTCILEVPVASLRRLRTWLENRNKDLMRQRSPHVCLRLHGIFFLTVGEDFSPTSSNTTSTALHICHTPGYSLVSKFQSYGYVRPGLSHIYTPMLSYHRSRVRERLQEARVKHSVCHNNVFLDVRIRLKPWFRPVLRLVVASYRTPHEQTIDGLDSFP